MDSKNRIELELEKLRGQRNIALSALRVAQDIVQIDKELFSGQERIPGLNSTLKTAIDAVEKDMA